MVAELAHSDGLELLFGLVDRVRARAGGQRVLVGIAGAPGAGKSTVAGLLVDRLAPDAALLPMDGFHLAKARLTELGRRERMGAPDTFDVEAFVTTLAAVRSRGLVLAPGFDRTTEEPVPDAIQIGPEPAIVVVEGNYLLHDEGGWQRVRELLDFCCYIEVTRELRLARLIARHQVQAAQAELGRGGPRPLRRARRHGPAPLRWTSPAAPL